MYIQKFIFTVLLFLGYLVLWYIKRKELLKTDGVDANVIFKSEKPVQKYFGFLEKTMTLALILTMAVHLFSYEDFIITKRLFGSDKIFTVAGFLIGLSGLMLCRLAQVTIGRSWRVGIDESVKPGLVTGGIYNYIRNPTYTGLFILCAGVWIINPTALFLYWILAFLIMMEFQVRCEEEYLEQQYGADYIQYFNKTKRYIPFCCKKNNTLVCHEVSVHLRIRYVDN